MTNIKKNKRIIAFAGRKRSGKTTLAKLLQYEENAVIITIANYLKYLCCDLLNISYDELIEKKDNGYVFDIMPDDRWFKIIARKTDINIESVRKELENVHFTTIREILQIIGTDVIRKYNENWHVQKMLEEIDSYSDDKLIAIDDVRFPNEKEVILSRSGEVFFIVRPSLSDISNHSSETALKWQDFDDKHVIINDVPSKKLLEQIFMVYYKNDFEINCPGSIFLSENTRYLKCSDFGHNTDSDDELLNDVLRQLELNKETNYYGVIRYKTCNRQMAKRYAIEIDNTSDKLDKHCNEFLTYNPLIIENLKKYF